MAPKKKLILEMRVNEYTMRDVSPRVPYTVDEIGKVADECREAGATAFHFHGRTKNGAPDLSFETYRAIVDRIRKGSDILVHPTLGAETQVTDPTTRLSNILQLSENDLAPDFVPLDMGSSNWDQLNADGTDFLTQENTYVNTTATLKFFAETIRKLSVKPYLQIWNAPQMRLAEIFHRLGILDGPVWMSFGHSLGATFANHPGTVAGLRAYLSLIPEGLPNEWSAAVYGGDIFDIAAEVISNGGHLALGTGDFAYPKLGTPSNAEIARRVVEMAKELGREIATPDEAKEMLGMS
ncbi:3-keto-5-aminohexanoate cleavage protein [Amycolatopsis japonica]